ncbi:MAG: hypothetical protein QW153_03070, partial [Candidatus Bilamarchaeaceae archaeon]
ASYCFLCISNVFYVPLLRFSAVPAGVFMFSPIFIASYEAFDFYHLMAKAYAHPNPKVFYLFIFYLRSL